MTLGLIWAEADGGVIGAGGTMPWHLPEDLKHFKELTGDDTVVMGRKTWESLPERFRPLPGRANIVITRQTGWSSPGVLVAHSLDEALTASTTGTTWVIGGSELFALCVPQADRIEITEIDLQVVGDTYAPRLDPTGWTIDPEPWQSAANGMRYRFIHWLR